VGFGGSVWGCLVDNCAHTVRVVDNFVGNFVCNEEHFSLNFK